MPPANIWQLLWRLVVPVRRHAAPTHDGKVDSARMDEARMDEASAARADAEQKLAGADDVVAHARGVLWRLRQQRSQPRQDQQHNEPNHGDGAG